MAAATASTPHLPILTAAHATGAHPDTHPTSHALL